MVRRCRPRQRRFCVPFGLQSRGPCQRGGRCVTVLLTPPPACPRAFFECYLTFFVCLAEYDDAAGDDSGVGGVKRQRLEALAGSDIASAYPDTSLQFDAAPALDHSSAIAAIAEAYAPVSRDKAIADQEKREAAAAAAKAAQAAATAKRQRDAAINQVLRRHRACRPA